MQDILKDIGIYAVPLLLAVVSHEVAHGWVAEKLGDPTARLLGRISFNPLVHIDPVGTVIIPLALLVTNAPFLFGWAKPVPVQFHRLHGGRKAMAWVALAGPLTNLMLAAVSALVYRLVVFLFSVGAASGVPGLLLHPLYHMARFSVVFNLVLMAVNLFPVPPLDGGRVLMGVSAPNIGPPCGAFGTLRHGHRLGLHGHGLVGIRASACGESVCENFALGQGRWSVFGGCEPGGWIGEELRRRKT